MQETSTIDRTVTMTARIIRIAAVAIGIASLAAANTLHAQATSEVRANGIATVSLDANLAIVTIQYSAGGRTPAIAGRQAATRANAIRAAIIAVGIPKDSIPTAGRWGRWGNRSEIQVRNEMKDTTYVTNDVFTVRIHDLALVGRVIDTSLAVGAQTISNVEFQATNTDAATIEAIKKATRMARSHAEAVAEAAGLKLGRAIELGVDGQAMPMASPMAYDVMSLRKADTGSTIVAPELKVTMSVSGRWELVAPR
jgi:uncharacterized protein YggE